MPTLPFLLKKCPITAIFLTRIIIFSSDGGLGKVDKFEMYMKIRELLEQGFTKVTIAKSWTFQDLL